MNDLNVLDVRWRLFRRFVPADEIPLYFSDRVEIPVHEFFGMDVWERVITGLWGGGLQIEERVQGLAQGPTWLVMV